MITHFKLELVKHSALLGALARALVSEERRRCWESSTSSEHVTVTTILIPLFLTDACIYDKRTQLESLDHRRIISTYFHVNGIRDFFRGEEAAERSTACT